MKVEIKKENYNGKLFTARIFDYTNKWFSNYTVDVNAGGDTKEEAKENLIEKYEEMISDINRIIYKK